MENLTINLYRQKIKNWNLSFVLSSFDGTLM